MTNKEILDRKIAEKEQIVLSYSCNTLKVFNIIIAFLCVISISSLLFYFKINKIALSVSTILGLLYFIFYINIKHYVSASIKGEMLLLKKMNNKNCVTEIRSIKSISSTTFLGYNYTKIKFKIDGINQTARLIKKIHDGELGNDIILKSAIKNVA